MIFISQGVNQSLLGHPSINLNHYIYILLRKKQVGPHQHQVAFSILKRALSPHRILSGIGATNIILRPLHHLRAVPGEQ